MDKQTKTILGETSLSLSYAEADGLGIPRQYTDLTPGELVPLDIMVPFRLLVYTDGTWAILPVKMRGSCIKPWAPSGGLSTSEEASASCSTLLEEKGATVSDVDCDGCQHTFNILETYQDGRTYYCPDCYRRIIKGYSE